MRSLFPQTTGLCLAAGFALAFMVPANGSAKVSFSRDVQPILSENCYHCHGPDAEARKAKLRLDAREGAFRTVDGVTVVAPGDVEKSELVVRILSHDADEVMPPPKSNRRLTEAQKALVQQWVAEGAPWGAHWAFVAPQRPPLPESPAAVRGTRNPIDRFIRARLEQEHLEPSPEAPREKLLRRVTLDLTGLPPTLPELDAFLADPAPDAYEHAVDRLLASPRYGERMLWDWLEAARYADTNGYQGDPTRPMWYWRDWALQALNQNLPYDRFTIEQLAGDLLPEPSRQQLIATGFHRNHMINGEGGRIPEESRVDYVMDRTETTGAVWLGLTLQCCRCHDHKFDPLKQQDYYRLSAYFNSIDETGGNDAGGLANPVLSLATPEQEAKLAQLRTAEKNAQTARDAIEKQLRSEQSAWEASLIDASGQLRTLSWRPLQPVEMSASHEVELVQSDGAIMARGSNPAESAYVIKVQPGEGAITGFKLVAEPDASLPGHGPGRADNGNFVLTELTLQHAAQEVPLEAVSADFEQDGFPARAAFDGEAKTGWAVQPAFGQEHILTFRPKLPLALEPGATLTFRIGFAFGRQHTLGRFRLFATTDPAALLQAAPDPVRAALRKPAAQRTPEETKEISAFHLAGSSELAAAERARAAAKAAREAAEKAAPRTMVMRERAQPRETFVLVKGNYEHPAERVFHGVPGFLPGLPESAPPNRLALARWLVAPENPLTARVTVNRLWQTFFGTGLVKTADDFGVQGEQPSHPELLDWLAVEFRESGWDVKKLARLMVTSATYRQASQTPPGMAERDPENRLLARGPRHRLPSWMLRDQALALSGLLVEKLGGPPVKGYQPAGVWEDATFGQIKYQQDHGEALYRRSLYTFWRRIVGPTLFFDVSSRQTCAVKTGITNTPLHALVTLNDVTYTEAARAFAETMLKRGPTEDAGRLTSAFRSCTARWPSAHETSVLQRALAAFREQYAADPAAASKLLTVGESRSDSALDPIEKAAYTELASLLLNLDETLSNE